MDSVSMKVKLPYYEAIRDGKKTVEGRPADGSFGSLQVSQQIDFKLDGDESAPIISVKITDVQKFPSFEQMIASVGREACLPGMTSSDDEAVAIYHSFPNYAGRAAAHGVVAIFIRRI